MDIPSLKGRDFEDYLSGLLPLVYSDYEWQFTGGDKQTEAGFDFIGINPSSFPLSRIVVQAKCHDSGRSPTKEEWLQFGSALLFRQFSAGFFITTGRLTREQRQQAETSGVIRVIEGIKAVDSLAKSYAYPTFHEWKKG
jgi:hypothetical protein